MKRRATYFRRIYVIIWEVCEEKRGSWSYTRAVKAIARKITTEMYHYFASNLKWPVVALGSFPEHTYVDWQYELSIARAIA